MSIYDGNINILGAQNNTGSTNSLVGFVKANTLLLAVPSIDGAFNANQRDVIGNKSDTTGGNSLVALVKTNTAQNTVPTTDVADNVITRDVIGSKSDTSAGTSLMGYAKLNQSYNLNLLAWMRPYTAYGTYAYTDAGGEQTIYEKTNSSSWLLCGLFLDATTITKDATIKLYTKIDYVNYREFASFTFSVATDSDGIYIPLNCFMEDRFKVTWTEGTDEGASRDIPYKLHYQYV